MKSKNSIPPWRDKIQKLAGFTLLELLVVISIIVILVTIGMSSYSTAQKKGRDAKRKSDLKEIQTALEQYYAVCGYQYPLITGFYDQVNCPTPAISIMPTVPQDPRGTPYYCPTPVSNCSSSTYTICSKLESESPAEYCLSNQQ